MTHLLKLKTHDINLSDDLTPYYLNGVISRKQSEELSSFLYSTLELKEQQGMLNMYDLLAVAVANLLANKKLEENNQRIFVNIHKQDDKIPLKVDGIKFPWYYYTKNFIENICELAKNTSDYQEMNRFINKYEKSGGNLHEIFITVIEPLIESMQRTTFFSNNPDASKEAFEKYWFYRSNRYYIKNFVTEERSSKSYKDGQIVTW